ncbi:hypothetical protein M9H77_21840 [Catharanthus roseus]|uniref:Uncharacterized protein n=1 Tax=Catharanthus roseus TaxID=4058 RepID=A0ACC0ANF3_CATRO|nr:hypothetical protein M9H77_21840 [Catharanthus roseus]
MENEGSLRYKLYKIINFLPSTSFFDKIQPNFLTTTCGTKPNHGMKAKEEGMGKELSISYEDTSISLSLNPFTYVMNDILDNFLVQNMSSCVKLLNQTFGEKGYDMKLTKDHSIISEEETSCTRRLKTSWLKASNEEFRVQIEGLEEFTKSSRHIKIIRGSTKSKVSTIIVDERSKEIAKTELTGNVRLPPYYPQ